MRIKSPAHKKWYRIICGQVEDCMRSHPEYFSDLIGKKPRREQIKMSIAKRVAGEIVRIYHREQNPACEAKIASGEAED